MPYTKTLEQKLIMDARSGDEAARNFLIEVHATRVGALARNRLSSLHVPWHIKRDLIDDLTQEGLQYLDKVIMERFDVASNNWLWTYARQGVDWAINTDFKRQRRYWQRRVISNELDTNFEEYVAAGTVGRRELPTPEDALRRQIVRETLEEVIHKALLTLRYRRNGEWVEQGVKFVVLIVLVYVERMSMPQVAVALAGRSRGEWQSEWTLIHQECHLPHEIPNDWDKILRLFHTGSSPRPASSEAELKRLEDQLTQFLLRQTRKLCEVLRDDPELDPEVY